MVLFKRILCIVCLILSFLCYSYAQVDSTHTISTTIEFRINTDNIIQNSNYYNYIDEIVPVIEQNKENIDYILLIGSASPEGNYDNNLKLANRRADKIYSFISDIVQRNKVIKNNDYELFLNKTGLDESDYRKLRATYIEIHFLKSNDEDSSLNSNNDTIYIVKRDTVTIVNNYYNNTEIINSNLGVHNKPVFAVYNDLVSDLLIRANLGAEVYFKKMSFFIEGSFSRTDLFGKAYNIDIWHTGLRKYFNDDYNKLFIEAYGNVGYFDTELLSEVGKIGILYGGGIGIGYCFDLCPHWKLYPIVRIGLFERIYYANYYYSENGNINISFGNYTNGKVDNGENPGTGNNTATVVTVSKTITKEFFENSNKAHYIGPTYVGIVLKRDFCINKKHKTQTK